MKRSNEVTVGILITVAVVVMVLGTLWLVRGGLKSGYPLYTRFAWGQNLKQGQPVLLAGVNVGYVGEVKLRRTGFLDVMIRVNDEFTVPKGSVATVKPIGIFGDVAVALTPPLPIPAANYSPGDTLPAGAPTADLAEITNRVDSIGINVLALTTALRKQVIDAGTLTDIHKTVASAAALSAQLQTVIAEQNRNLTATMRTFSDVANKANRTIDSADVQATIVNLRRTSENAARLSASLDSTNNEIRGLLAQAKSGKGTIGKLLSDTAFYQDMRNSLHNIDSLIADFKANPKKYINLRIF